jgi:uncharacterized integral membrane protein
MKVVKLALQACFVISLLAVFGALTGQNQEPMTFTLFNYRSPEYPKWGLLMGAFLIGAVVSSVFFVIQLVVLETRNIRLRRTQKKLERALSQQNPASSSSTVFTSPNGNGHSLPAGSSSTNLSTTTGQSPSAGYKEPTFTLSKSFEDEEV